MMENLTYLYVEDDSLSREALGIIMSRVMGLSNVHIFSDSTSFLERVRALPSVPDVIMLDIHMKPHDGFEMLSMLRSDTTYSDTIVIALTASVMNEEIQTLKNSGFDGIIGKPITVSTFPDLLQRIAAGEKIWHITDM